MSFFLQEMAVFKGNVSKKTKNTFLADDGYLDFAEKDAPGHGYFLSI